MINYDEKIDYRAFMSEKIWPHFYQKTFSAESFLVSRLVCQPTDRSVVQVQKNCNLSLAVPVTMHRPDNQRVSLGLG